MYRENQHSTNNHTIISGTGRAGTSFLVKLLTKLGLDTGFSPDSLEENIFPECNAGLELDIRVPGAPYQSLKHP